jgi:mRNA interferase RelE/StbE
MRGTGIKEEWRIRIGDYRVVYRVDDEAREVLILAVGHRGGVYG